MGPILTEQYFIKLCGCLLSAGDTRRFSIVILEWNRKSDRFTSELYFLVILSLLYCKKCGRTNARSLKWKLISSSFMKSFLFLDVFQSDRPCFFTLSQSYALVKAIKAASALCPPCASIRSLPLLSNNNRVTNCTLYKAVLCLVRYQ